MREMKQRSKFISSAAVAALLGGVILAGPAQAAYYVGAICHPHNIAEAMNVDGPSARFPTSAGTAVCAVPQDENIGTDIQWRIRVNDQSATFNAICSGSTFSSTAQLIFMTQSMQTSGVGAVDLAPPNGPEGLSTYNHSASCALRDNMFLESLRLY